MLTSSPIKTTGQAEPNAPAASPWMTSAEACTYLRFTGSDRLNSLYRFLNAHGVRRRWRSARRLLVSRVDIDAALAGKTAARRRNAIAREQEHRISSRHVYDFNQPDCPDGVRILNPDFDGYTVGQVVVHDIAAPGRGRWYYRVTRITDDTVFAVAITRDDARRLAC